MHTLRKRLDIQMHYRVGDGDVFGGLFNSWQKTVLLQFHPALLEKPLASRRGQIVDGILFYIDQRRIQKIGHWIVKKHLQTEI